VLASPDFHGAPCFSGVLVKAPIGQTEHVWWFGYVRVLFTTSGYREEFNPPAAFAVVEWLTRESPNGRSSGESHESPHPTSDELKLPTRCVDSHNTL